MIKSILYTSNPSFVPTTLEQVSNFAEENGKFLTCFAKEGSELYSVEKGAHILSGKGNHIYILDTGDDYSYAKKSNINDIVQMDYPFGEKPLYNPAKSAGKNTLAGFAARLKSTFMPTEATDVRIAQDGNICVATNQGYVAIDAQNHLTSYPEEFTLPFPVFIMCKPKEALVVGDIIALDRSYAKVTSIKGDKINAISYTGTGKVIRTIKDFLFNQTMVRVVVTPFNNFGGQMNPMMNPMMFFALSKGNEMGDSLSSLVPFMMMGGANPFGNMFGTAQAKPAEPAVEEEGEPVKD